jgi:hypothetical protein
MQALLAKWIPNLFLNFVEDFGAEMRLRDTRNGIAQENNKLKLERQQTASEGNFVWHPACLMGIRRDRMYRDTKYRIYLSFVLTCTVLVSL